MLIETYFLRERKELRPMIPKRLFKAKNEGTVISTIIESGEIDRTRLAKETNMSLSTVSRIVRSLIDRGMVEEIGSSVSSGGRKPILLRFNAYYRFVVGVKIGLGYANFVVTNLIGDVIVRFTREFDRFEDPEITLDRLLRDARNRLKANGIEIKKVIGIGVAVSGSVDQKKGTLVFSGVLGWRNVGIAGIFNKIMNVPVVVLNDVKSFTLAQLWKGRASGYENFLSVTVGTGIGLGVVIGGRLYLGSGNAGEFGHITVNTDGERCTCGRKGCLETEVSFHALMREMRKRNGSERIRALVSRIVEKEEREEILLQTLRKVKNEDESFFDESFERFRKFLGVGLADLVNIFNPPLIIIGGEALEFKDHFIDRVSGYLKENAFNVFGTQVEMVMDGIGEDAWSLGVIYLLIEKAFGRELITEEVTRIRKA